MSSILTTVKKNLGLEDAYTAFDADIILYINATLSTLNQLGIGPELGFQIEDKTATWESFLGTDLRLNNVKSFVVMSVKLMFDPPATSFGIAALEKQIEEAVWRISVKREGESWIDPTIPVVIPLV